MHRRRQWSDESRHSVSSASAPTKRRGPAGGRFPRRHAEVCRAPSFTDSNAECETELDSNAATPNPIAIIKDPRMTIIRRDTDGA